MSIDLIEEVTLPSQGLVYDNQITWKNRLRAPRLMDRGIGDLTRKNMLQAGILDKTLLEPLGISAYDLHVADFIYLNFMQRQISKGDKPYLVKVKCAACKREQEADIPLSEIKIKKLKEKPSYVFTTSDKQDIEYSYMTPKIFDLAKENADQFKEDFPEANQDVYLQELLRLVIKTIDGQKLTYSQITGAIGNLLLSDVDALLVKIMTYDFGLDLEQSVKCTNCGKKIIFNLPV